MDFLFPDRNDLSTQWFILIFPLVGHPVLVADDTSALSTLLTRCNIVVSLFRSVVTTELVYLKIEESARILLVPGS